MTQAKGRHDEAEEWLSRILEAFKGPTGMSSERVFGLGEIEKQHTASLFKLNGGYAALMDAFPDLYVQTLEEFCEHPQRPTPYVRTIFLATFWRFRAAYIIFWKGYYFDAASLLRAIFENILFYGAVMNGVLSETALFDVPEFGAALPQRKKEKIAAKHQRDIARLVQARMIGSDSGLSLPVQEGLRKILGLLHSHVHRAESNIVSILMHGIRGDAVPLIPPVDIDKASIFNNSSVFAGWAMTRLLPFLSEPKLFSSNWHSRYRVLDESFAQFMAGFDRDFARTVESFIEQKMTFPLA